MVQLAVIPALSAAVAGGAQESERAFWFWGPLILPVSENPALLQPLPVFGDGGVLGDTSGCPPPAALCWETPLLWTGTPHWSSKLGVTVLLQHLSSSMRPRLCDHQFYAPRVILGKKKHILPAAIEASRYNFSILNVNLLG